ncbi:MAG: hypothetical protein HKP61_22810 [Dactylosporangium sp.]|nr:hypothetical protein [Dactylosporangium sp.]NNJ63709.1 hypothetical protein [Dactylosporangium sp.]
MRRTLCLVLAALTGALVLSGCRSDPTVAAYVGSEQYTLRDVNEMLKGVEDTLDTLSEAQRGTISYATIRQLALRALVLGDLAERIAADRGIPVPAADRGAVLQGFAFPADSDAARVLLQTRFAEEITRTDAALRALAQAAPAVEPTEADQREAYTNLTAGGQPIAETFEAVRPYLTRQTIGQGIGLKQWLQESVDHYHVVVNPKYAPLEWNVSMWLSQTVETFVVVPLATR